MCPWSYCIVRRSLRVLIDCFSAPVGDRTHLVPSLFKEKPVFEARRRFSSQWQLTLAEQMSWAQWLAPTFHYLPVSLCNAVVRLMLGRAFLSPLVQHELLGFLIRCLSSDLVGCPVMLHPEVTSVTHKWGTTWYFRLYSSQSPSGRAYAVKTSLRESKGWRWWSLQDYPAMDVGPAGTPKAGASPQLRDTTKENQAGIVTILMSVSALISQSHKSLKV